MKIFLLGLDVVAAFFFFLFFGPTEFRPTDRDVIYILAQFDGAKNEFLVEIVCIQTGAIDNIHLASIGISLLSFEFDFIFINSIDTIV